MLESTHEHSFLNSGTMFLSAPLQGKLCKNSHENSLSPTQQFMDQNNILIMPHEQISMWLTWFPPATSRVSLWTHLDHLPMSCGIYFSCFLFINPIVDLIIMILRHLEISRLTVASLGFGKTLLGASYNLFLTCFSTSVFNPQAPFCKRWNLNQRPQK